MEENRGRMVRKVYTSHAEIYAGHTLLYTHSKVVICAVAIAGVVLMMLDCGVAERSGSKHSSER